MPYRFPYTIVLLLAATAQTTAQATTQADEPERRMARLLEQADEPSQAAADWLMAEQAGQIDRETAEAGLRWLQAHQRQTSFDRAAALARELGADWSTDRHNHFWIGQAQLMLGLDAPRDAERALGQMREPLDPALVRQRQSMLGHLLIEQRRFRDALALLENRQGFPRDALFDRYNFGVLLVEQGRRAEGMAILDELGQTRAGTGPENRALLDRANLAVGWSWLAGNQGGTARAFFKRVSLEGPYTDMALLGLGWAALAPDGKPQDARFKRELMCDDVLDPPVSVSMLLFMPQQFCRPGRKASTFRYHHRFAFEPGKPGAARLRQALIPWNVLQGRGLQHPAVQEAAVAIGYVHEKLREYAEAERAYRRAIAGLEAEARRLAALESTLRNATTDPLTLTGRARDDEFRAVLGAAGHQRAMARIESLQPLAAQLKRTDAAAARYTPRDERQRRQQQTLRTRTTQALADLETLELHLKQEIRRAYLNDIRQRQQRLDRYRSGAALALARLYDRHSDALQRPR